jgi:hypothetical protein
LSSFSIVKFNKRDLLYPDVETGDDDVVDVDEFDDIETWCRKNESDFVDSTKWREEELPYGGESESRS